MASTRRTLIAGLFVAGAALAGLSQAQQPRLDFGPVNRDVLDVSLVQLIANAEKFDGRPVRVYGVIQLEFEGNALYLSKEHLHQGIYKNAVWLSPDYALLEAKPEELRKLNGRYVLVEGRFSAKNTGHLGLFSGAIENVTRLMYREK